MIFLDACRVRTECGPLILQKLGDPRLSGINHVDDEGQSALHLAAEHGDVATVTHLLKDSRLLIDARYPGGWTPLIAACQAHPWEVVDLLLADPRLINLGCNDSGRTALSHVCEAGNLGLAARFLSDPRTGDPNHPERTAGRLFIMLVPIGTATWPSSCNRASFQVSHQKSDGWRWSHTPSRGLEGQALRDGRRGS